MRITILDDNTVMGYYKGEWGLSMYIEDERGDYLFDMGYSDIFLKNMIQMNYNIERCKAIILSHGHNDHTGGLQYLLDFYNFKKIKKNRRPLIIAHPDILKKRISRNGVSIGFGISEDELYDNFNIVYTKKPYKISDKIFFMGEICKEKTLCIEDDTVYKDDEIKDDSGIVFCGKNGLVVLSGCAHSGICNLVNHAINMTGVSEVQAVLGGFHMLSPSVESINTVKDYFRRIDCDNLYPCHCTDFMTKMILSKDFNVHSMGVGVKLEFY